MLNKELIKRKISFIQNELVYLQDLAKFSFQEIASDYMKEHTLERILEKIINPAIDINQHMIAQLAPKEMSPPKDYKETFPKLAEVGVYPEEFGESISKSVGTRNALVHEYETIDYSKIYSSISDCLREYHQYCDFILKFIEKN